MTASTADYYGILGPTSDATLADVKKAYRKLARQHHPDRKRRPHPRETPQRSLARRHSACPPLWRITTIR